MLTVTLSGDQYGPDLVQAEIWAGAVGPINVQVSARYPREAQSFEIVGDLGPDPVLTVYFKNDAWGGLPSLDRNLYFLGATVDGVWFPPPDDNRIALTNGYCRMPLLVKPPAPTVPSFVDNFDAPDATRFIAWDGKNWPPLPNTGRWARCYFQGWPDNSGSQDCAARSLAANHEAQCYEDRGVSLGAGGLILTATRDSNNHHNLPWTSGCIVQARELAQLYGYFEADIQTSNIDGFWPAFWLLAQSRKYPPELDVMEQVCKDASDAWNPSIYRAGCVGGQGAGHWKSMVDNSKSHKYGMLWTKNVTSFFFDRMLIGAEPTPLSAQEPMYMLLDLAAGGPGAWPGIPSVTVNKATMTIRSVKSYALGSWGPGLLPNF